MFEKLRKRLKYTLISSSTILSLLLLIFSNVIVRNNLKDFFVNKVESDTNQSIKLLDYNISIIISDLKTSSKQDYIISYAKNGTFSSSISDILYTIKNNNSMVSNISLFSVTDANIIYTIPANGFSDYPTYLQLEKITIINDFIYDTSRTTLGIVRKEILPSIYQALLYPNYLGLFTIFEKIFDEFGYLIGLISVDIIPEKIISTYFVPQVSSTFKDSKTYIFDFRGDTVNELNSNNSDIIPPKNYQIDSSKRILSVSTQVSNFFPLYFQFNTKSLDESRNLFTAISLLLEIFIIVSVSLITFYIDKKINKRSEMLLKKINSSNLDSFSSN
jgi:cell division protein FtsB